MCPGVEGEVGSVTGVTLRSCVSSVAPGGRTFSLKGQLLGTEPERLVASSGNAQSCDLLVIL